MATKNPESQENTQQLENISDTKDQNEDQNQNQNDSQPDGLDTQTEFNHPGLKGKTREQIEQIFRLQDATIAEQRKTIKLVRDTQQERGDIGRPNPAEETKPTRDKYYEDPVDVLDNRLEAALNKVVAPLREEIRQTRRMINTESPRQKLAKKYPEFTKLEPTMDAMLTAFGIDPEQADENLLETTYHATYSKALHEGTIEPPSRRRSNRDEEDDNNDTRNNSNTRRNNVIPQNRPSPAPAARNRADEQKLPELSENERRLAREYFPNMSIEKAIKAYIELQNEEPENVVHSKAGKEEEN